MKRNSTLVAQYERTRADVRANQAVDAAEDILGHAWVDQLAALRREVTGRIRGVCRNAQTAQRLLQRAEADGDEHEIAAAQRLFIHARSELGTQLVEARRTLAEIDAELQCVHRAALGRLDRRHTDFERLQAAHVAAFGGGDC